MKKNQQKKLKRKKKKRKINTTNSGKNLEKILNQVLLKTQPTDKNSLNYQDGILQRIALNLLVLINIFQELKLVKIIFISQLEKTEIN